MFAISPWTVHLQHSTFSKVQTMDMQNSFIRNSYLDTSNDCIYHSVLKNQWLYHQLLVKAEQPNQPLPGKITQPAAGSAGSSAINRADSGWFTALGLPGLPQKKPVNETSSHSVLQKTWVFPDLHTQYIYIALYRGFQNMVVPPSHPFIDGFSITNHPASLGYPHLWKTPIWE